MSRTRVRLAIDGEKLRELIGARETFTERAQKFGVTKQALNEWMKEGFMPPRAIAEFIHDIDASVEDVEALLAPQREVAARKKRYTLTITLNEE